MANNYDEPSTNASSFNNLYFLSWPPIKSSLSQQLENLDAGYDVDVSGDSPIHNNEDLCI
jgi:hypothetical protein